jgi:hypothetical protein
MVGAYVRGRPLAPDMLLTSCEGQTVGALAARVDRLTHQAPRHLADMREPGCHKAKPRTAELRRNPEALALADGNIGSQLGWRFQQSERQSLGGCRNQKATSVMYSLGNSSQRFDDSEHVGLTNNHAEKAVISQLFECVKIGGSRGAVKRKFDQLDFGLHSKIGTNRGAVVGP